MLRDHVMITSKEAGDLFAITRMKLTPEASVSARDRIRNAPTGRTTRLLELQINCDLIHWDNKNWRRLLKKGWQK
jgi:hypothetical protein